MRQRLFIALIIILTLFVTGCSVGEAPKPQSGAEVGITAGKTAPSFTLSGLEGRQINALQPGKVTIINFWATWCPPCREEMPELEKFWQANRQKVSFYAVNIQESGDKVRAFLDQRGIAVPVLLDTDGNVAQLYRVNAIPTTLVIDSAGIIKYRKTGPVNQKELEGILKGL